MEIHELCPGCMRRVTEEQIQSGCPYCGYCTPASGGAAPHILAPRTVLEGKYMIGRTLGAGGCGITYLGFDLNLELRIAIKEYYPVGFVSRDTGKSNMVISEEGDKGRFFTDGKKKYIQEARMLARFSGLRNIVSVRDYFEENNTCYIIMEYLDGETLKSYLTRRGGRISCDEIMRMLRPLLASLNEVHQQGMIHRDISPDNIMILKDGTLKLLDFGSARDMAGNAERSASVMLKPGYAPEEQYRIYGEQGSWTDVYALCATIYRCLTGRTPVDALSRKEHDTLIPPSQYGAVLTPVQEAALLKGMAVDVAQRYKTLGEFYQGFYCNEIPVAQAVRSGGPPPQQAAGRRTPQTGMTGSAQWGMSGQSISPQQAAGQRTPQTGTTGSAQWGMSGQSISPQQAAGQRTPQTGTTGSAQWGVSGQSLPPQTGNGPQNGLSYPAYQVPQQTSYVLQEGRRKRFRAVITASVLAAAALAIVSAIWAFSAKRQRAGEDAAWAQGELAGEETGDSSIGGRPSEEGGSDEGNNLPQQNVQQGGAGGLSLPNGLAQNVPDSEPAGDFMHGLSQSLDSDPAQQSNAPRLCYEIPEEFEEWTQGYFYSPDYPSDPSNIIVMTADNDSVTFQYTKESFCDTLERFYSEYYDMQVDVECTEFTKSTIDGYNLLIVRLRYDLRGVALEQVECAVETEKDKVTTITMSQPAGGGWEDAFERVLDSIRVE